uniref:Uncharacterized protein n=1 Tax=Spongospora subterranea TaxID=70186 RepID=A0A0H5QGE8_9EUKA|eukprot:CRZ01123.1 hypothetical protein [Spongospora subterranea]
MINENVMLFSRSLDRSHLSDNSKHFSFIGHGHEDTLCSSRSGYHWDMSVTVSRWRRQLRPSPSSANIAHNHFCNMMNRLVAGVLRHRAVYRVSHRPIAPLSTRTPPSNGSTNGTSAAAHDPVPDQAQETQPTAEQHEEVAQAENGLPDIAAMADLIAEKDAKLAEVTDKLYRSLAVFSFRHFKSLS